MTRAVRVEAARERRVRRATRIRSATVGAVGVRVGGARGTRAAESLVTRYNAAALVYQSLPPLLVVNQRRRGTAAVFASGEKRSVELERLALRVGEEAS